MTPPLVSICLPNLNNVSYLPERLETIRRQTCADWELVVSDNYSDDGAWDLFEEAARMDRRIAIAQAPREGLYANWNRCIRRARGTYVYIATSDDTMADDCLEKMVGALEAHPECDVAHCPLRAIDERGHDVLEMCAWWSGRSIFAASSGPLLHRRHVRLAPFDGLLHLLGGSVYISITQLLIRRALFDRIGVFEARWGSMGDFNWNMRASLVASTVHVPNTWGGWRLHPAQATAGIGLGSAGHAHQIDDMLEHAVHAAAPLLPVEVRRHLEGDWWIQARHLRAFEREVARRTRPAPRRAYVIGRALAGSMPAWEHLKSKFTGSSNAEVVRTWLDRAGLAPPLVAAERVPPPAAAANHADATL